MLISAKNKKEREGGSLQPGIEPGSGQLKPAFYHCAGASKRVSWMFRLYTSKHADFSKKPEIRKKLSLRRDSNPRPYD